MDFEFTGLDISNEEIDTYLSHRDARVAGEVATEPPYLHSARSIANEPSSGLAILLSFHAPARRELVRLAEAA